MHRTAAHRVGRWLTTDAWLWAYTWLVRRAAIGGGFVVALGAACASVELTLRALGFIAFAGYPIGVAICAIGAGGLVLAFLTYVVLGVSGMLFDPD